MSTELKREDRYIVFKLSDGWKLVPIEPTQEMLNHVIDERLEALVAGKEHTFIDIYKAMLAAAPKPEGECRTGGIEMTINITELRRLAQAATPGPDGVSLSWIKLLQDFQQGANPAAINELLDRLEAAEKAVTEAYQRGYATGQEEIEKERDALRALVVMRFDHDYPPQFTQGHDLHELTEPVTAEHCRWFVAEIERLRTDCDALRAKIAAMEQQEPVAWLHESRRDSDVVTSAVKQVWQRARPMSLASYTIPPLPSPRRKMRNQMSKATESIFDGKDVLIPLAEVSYILKFPNCVEVHFKGSAESVTLVQPDQNALISAWCRYRSEVEADTLMDLDGAQPAPMAVAYLDIGAGGYMDIGTDLTDEALAALPKGRHMLGIVGTYGVDGYVPAQPAPTIAEQDQINAEAAIRSIYGARPNDEALWQTIVNDMITPAHTAQAVADGPITPAHTMQLAPSIPEGVSFIDTSQLTGVVSTEIVHSYPPPSGWLRAINEALVATHLGVANVGDTYEQAKAKLDSLIGFHVDVATDPAVNGGWKLMPVEPTEEVYQCFSAYDGTSYSNPFDRDEFLKDWRAALAAAPEAKP